MQNLQAGMISWSSYEYQKLPVNQKNNSFLIILKNLYMKQNELTILLPGGLERLNFETISKTMINIRYLLIQTSEVTQ